MGSGGDERVSVTSNERSGVCCPPPSNTNKKQKKAT